MSSRRAPAPDAQPKKLFDYSKLKKSDGGNRKTGTGSKKKRNTLLAEHAALLYMKAERKAARHPAPHGYGNGYFECICDRCTLGAREPYCSKKRLRKRMRHGSRQAADGSSRECVTLCHAEYMICSLFLRCCARVTANS